ncbi:SUN domain-containing protein 1-like isoform X3 [Carcharodon carcharias]|uniref:SUN domain-containing protein 1-like isoform X3 n=1 Tax=Carcharodon carcharias TaxID=13397 RepID=UPI001B7EAD31|nr:SUN domain-containing protein 1-like isoform X3 [Carcharodon carcharias]
MVEQLSMDFSRLHTYAPPQYVPENTGYTYALSSSYSTEAVDFESTHQLHPVYDSPRMSRRRLRPVSNEFYSAESVHNESIGSNHSFTGSLLSYKESSSRNKQQQKHKSASKQTVSVSHTPRKSMVESSVSSHSSILSYGTDTSMMSTVLDESSIREKTELGHFWGLDDEDGDSKGGNTTLIRANGDIVTGEMQTALFNGYTCNDCSILSERKDVLTAYCASQAPSSTVYSRSKNKKDKSRVQLFMNHTLQLAKYTVSTAAAWFLQLYQTLLLKTGFYSKAHSSYCGRMNVKELITGDGHLNINGESLCDDCKGMKHDTYKSTEVGSTKYMKFTQVTRTIWLVFAYAGSLLLQVMQAAGAVAWFVSRKVLSILWLAIVSPGKAASGAFWWLGTGWYQLITLMSLLDVFLLTRCLSRLLRWLFLLIPLLFLFAGLWYFGLAGLWSLLPVLNGTAVQTAQGSKETVPTIRTNGEIPGSLPLPRSTGHSFDWSRVTELEKQIAVLSDQCSQSSLASDERYSQLASLLQKLQEQIGQMNDKEAIVVLIRNLIRQHSNVLQEEMKQEGTDVLQNQFMALHQKHEFRIAELEFLLKSLSNRSEEVYKEVEIAKASTLRYDAPYSFHRVCCNSHWILFPVSFSFSSNENEEQYQHLISELKRLDMELSTVKSELSNMQELKASCAKIDGIQGNVNNQVRELVNLLVFGNKQTSSESFKEWLSSQFANQTELHVLLKNLEMKILKNLTQHWIETKKLPDAQVAACAVMSAGISGISEEQVHIIVDNALKLYSEDKTGMVDFALESGGGSILSTRCSETYETATAVMSLFGVPLWYFSQSPRVVIQPDVHPGNCWAFKGSQGYLVIRLSVEIHPSAFTLEHVPKSLSPAGNISSAPKDFNVYGLDDEYQEEGTIFGKYTYNQDGEAIQTFPVREESLKSYQIIELRIFSNWGHPEYTCLYRFRVHGNPRKQ